PSSGAAGLAPLGEKVESFGGRVEEVSPEGLRAVFGLEPIEDAARRAAHAALAIQKVAARTDGSLPRSSGARVGLHIGEFLVARVGDVPRVDHSAKRGAWQQLEALMAAPQPRTPPLTGAPPPFLPTPF